MEVRPGYKQTDYGLIPADWDVVALANLLESFKNGYAFNAEGYSLIGMPIITMAQIGLDGGFQFDEGRVNKWPIEKAKDLRGFYLQKGDLIIAMTDVTPSRNLIGRMTSVTVDGPLLLNQRVGRLRVNKKKVNPELLRAISNTPVWRTYCRGTSTLGVQANLSTPDILHGKVPIPSSIAEQEAIAAALSDADALIESLEQLIAKKRMIKKGAMQELLTGKRRLPGFSGKWLEKKLKSFLVANPDYGINAAGVQASGAYPTYLRITDIDDDGRLVKVNQVAVAHPLAMNYVLAKNDIVFARTGASVGKTYLYDECEGQLVFAGFLIRARIDHSKLSPRFLFAYTRTAAYWNWVRIMSMRSGQPGINGTEYASMPISIPPTLDEQMAISNIFSEMDADIAAHEEKLTKSRLIKQGMMQQLLTGRIRLI